MLCGQDWAVKWSTATAQFLTVSHLLKKEPGALPELLEDLPPAVTLDSASICSRLKSGFILTLVYLQVESSKSRTYEEHACLLSAVYVLSCLEEKLLILFNERGREG